MWEVLGWIPVGCDDGFVAQIESARVDVEDHHLIEIGVEAVQDAVDLVASGTVDVSDLLKGCAASAEAVPPGRSGTMPVIDESDVVHDRVRPDGGC